MINLGPEGIRAEMAAMGVDEAGIGIMEGKSGHHCIRLDEVDLRAALILKQDMLSLGGDAALARGAAGLKIRATPVLLMGTRRQVRTLAVKLREQPFGLGSIARSIEDLLENMDRTPRYVVGGEDLLAGRRRCVSGILNVTDDSFSDGGRYVQRDRAVARGLQMVAEGADIIDVGGESTRPGAGAVTAGKEVDRVVPVIKDLVREGVRVISVDTTKAEVAQKAVEAGASIVNDVSGMTFDPDMLPFAASAGVSVTLMHTRGRPDTMQDDLDYRDLMGEIGGVLEEAMDAAVASGIPVERICIDPGIGFGKSACQNVEILARVGELRSLGAAVMVGASRKSFIGHMTGADVNDRLPGSISAAVAAVLNGADIVRVHDVAETVQALGVVSDITGRYRC